MRRALVLASAVLLASACGSEPLHQRCQRAGEGWLLLTEVHRGWQALPVEACPPGVQLVGS